MKELWCAFFFLVRFSWWETTSKNIKKYVTLLRIDLGYLGVCENSSIVINLFFRAKNRDFFPCSVVAEFFSVRKRTKNTSLSTPIIILIITIIFLILISSKRSGLNSPNKFFSSSPQRQHLKNFQDPPKNFITIFLLEGHSKKWTPQFLTRFSFFSRLNISLVENVL